MKCMLKLHLNSMLNKYVCLLVDLDLNVNVILSTSIGYDVRINIFIMDSCEQI